MDTPVKENYINNVDHPAHYTSSGIVIICQCNHCGKTIQVPVECIDVVRNMPTWKGCAVKYLWREGLKKDASLSDKEKEIEDLEKAIWYIKDRIKQLNSSED